MSINIETLCDKLEVPYYVGADLFVIEKNIYTKIDELIVLNDILQKEVESLEREFDVLHNDICHLADRHY